MDYALLIASRVGSSLFPVVLFLIGLTLLDSYKLVRPAAVVFSVAAGAVAAFVAFILNSNLIGSGIVEFTTLTRYVAPAVEEILKASFLVYLVRSSRIGFVVDAAIHGFAIGAGFALLENVYYLATAGGADFWTWIVRGFGTAIMHGGTTAILAMIIHAGSERSGSVKIEHVLKGLAAAIALHSIFNHFILPPVVATLLLIVVLPPLFALVFHFSDESTRTWLRTGFDTDQELLAQIRSGEVVHTRVGRYLSTLRSHFEGPIVVDMLCLLRLHAELSVRAKGILMMRQAGFTVPPDASLSRKFEELRYLEQNIGPTGMLAIRPFLHTSSRSLWQLHMLANAHVREAA